MSGSRYVTLPREQREGLTLLLEATRPGDTLAPTAWGRSRGVALRRLADTSLPLDEALALRIDALLRQGRRSALHPLPLASYRKLRAEMGAFVDMALDEIAESSPVHEVLTRAAA